MGQIERDSDDLSSVRNAGRVPLTANALAHANGERCQLLCDLSRAQAALPDGLLPLGITNPRRVAGSRVEQVEGIRDERVTTAAAFLDGGAGSLRSALEKGRCVEGADD